MSHTLTQPQEVELVLTQEGLCESTTSSSSPFGRSRSLSDSLRRGYVSPYRAAYLNAMQAERNLHLQLARG